MLHYIHTNTKVIVEYYSNQNPKHSKINCCYSFIERNNTNCSHLIVMIIPQHKNCCKLIYQQKTFFGIYLARGNN